MCLVEDSLLAQHIRQPHNTTRPQNRATNQPTSIRQRRHRQFHVVTVAITPKGSVASAVSPIHANVKLVQMIGIVRSLRVVIRRSRIGRRRKACQQSLRSRIKRYVDHVVRKLLANELSTYSLRRRRIEDLRNTGKNTLSLRHRWDSRDARHPNPLLPALVVAKEEELVMNDRSAKRSPI